MLTLEDLGYHLKLENFRKEQDLLSFGVGRVISEHRERYVVRTESDEFEAEVVGNLRFSAQSRSDFPVVGDWVAISEYGDNRVLIHAVYPRKTWIERQAVGKFGEKQLIAANIDYAFLVQAVDRDFNINRLERYLTLCHASGIRPIVLLTKIDLISEAELERIMDSAKLRISGVPILAISNESRMGYDELHRHMRKGYTYCVLGSSGAGKSTLANNLAGKAAMKTDAISRSTGKGKHVTSHRELVVLESGGLLIDNPGMREVGITDAKGGLETTFATIYALSSRCRFKDCTHVHEDGCAVIEAVEKGELDTSTYENYLKMEKEREHFESNVADRRKKDKEFGKLIKNYYKDQRKNES